MWRLLSRTQGRFRGDGEDPTGQVTGSIAQTEGTNKEREAGKLQGSLCAFQVCLEAKLTVGETRQVGQSHSGKGLYFVSKQREAEKWHYYIEFTGRN